MRWAKFCKEFFDIYSNGEFKESGEYQSPNHFYEVLDHDHFDVVATSAPKKRQIKQHFYVEIEKKPGK